MNEVFVVLMVVNIMSNVIVVNCLLEEIVEDEA